jgi:hypothetical protein
MRITGCRAASTTVRTRTTPISARASCQTQFAQPAFFVQHARPCIGIWRIDRRHTLSISAPDDRRPAGHQRQRLRNGRQQRELPVYGEPCARTVASADVRHGIVGVAGAPAAWLWQGASAMSPGSRLTRPAFPDCQAGQLLTRSRRRTTPPIVNSPINSIAQVSGSGTAATATRVAPLVALKLNDVNW